MRTGAPTHSVGAERSHRVGRLTRAATLVGLLAYLGCTPQGDPSFGSEFVDAFDRQHLGARYRSTGGNWHIADGQLNVRGAKNHPLWLRHTLPRDVQIEFDVKSMTPDGDIKVEIFGDGSSFAKTTSYVATSYVVIFGGWGNTLNVLARLDEHGADRVVDKTKKVVTGQRYHFKIERIGTRIQVWVDGDLLLQMDDPQPLAGRGHDHFGFNNWQSDLWFDNLKIRAL